MYPKQKNTPRVFSTTRETKSIFQHARKALDVAGVNGFSNIAQAKNKRGGFLWFIVLGCALGGWMYQTFMILDLYYSYPTVVNIEVEKHEKMQFPSVTICNVNRIRRTVYCDEFPDECTASKTTILLTKTEIKNMTLDFMKKGKGEKSKLGHQLNDMVMKCEFTGIPPLETEECLKLFTQFYEPKTGNCYYLSSGLENSKKLYVSEPNLWKDLKELTLILNVEREEYLNSEEDTPGIMVTIHDDMTFPNVFADGIHVHPRKVYNIAVEKVTIKMLEKPYRSNCTNYDHLPFRTENDMDLTPRMCTVECVKYLQQVQCGHNYVSDDVVIFYDELPYDESQVTKDDVACGKKVSNASVEHCTSLCGVPCLDTSYTVNVDLTPKVKKMISEEDLEAYFKRTNKQHEDNENSNYVRMHIHYKHMEHKTFRHTPEFNTEQLFSYIGGITGGWLGISLLDFCALGEAILSSVVYAITYSRQSRKRRRRKVTPWKGKPRILSEVGQIITINGRHYTFDFPNPYY